MMMAWNRDVFLLINAPAAPDPLVVLTATFLANDAVFLVMALLVALWIWGGAEGRAGLLSSVLVTAAALGVNQLLGMLWFEPRPFMAGIGRTLLAHAPDNSFPSDHGTFLWSVGFSLIATAASRRWGVAVALVGVAVAWARIYLGVHFPGDMAAAALVGLSAAAAARRALSPMRRRVLPVVEGAYEAVIRALRLSPIVFPRRPPTSADGRTPDPCHWPARRSGP